MKQLPIYVSDLALERLRNGRPARAVVEQSAMQTVDLYSSKVNGCVRYEPAVPKCATCEHYQFVAADTDEESGMTCESGAMVILDLPQDGTGYCHNHSSKK